MDELIEAMKVVLASTFAFYLKAHNFHWNVEGPNFPQYHKFFKSIYEDAFTDVDDTAERIRSLGAYAPGSMSRYQNLSKIDEQINVPSAINMVRELESDNRILISELKKAYSLAEKVGEIGISNYVQGRVEACNKLGWMLRATSKVNQ
jgi:starvation-inducible DNA-binding protein